MVSMLNHIEIKQYQAQIALVLSSLHHGIKLGVEFGFNLVLEHGSQKAQFRFELERSGADVQLPLHAITVKVQHILRITCLIAALHAKFGCGFFSPGLGVLTGGG